MQIPITAKEVWENAIMSGIAHALFTARFPDFSFTHSWDGANYSVNNAQGVRGTIAFRVGDDVSLVGAFFDEQSSRNPFQNGGELFTSQLQSLLPSELSDLATKEAFLYLLQEWKGKDIPIVTALFWGNGDSVVCSESVDDFLHHGGRIVKRELTNSNAAHELLRDEFELTDAELMLAKDLFRRVVLAGPSGDVYLSRDEIQFLKDSSVDDEALSLCLESLAEIGIHSRC